MSSFLSIDASQMLTLATSNPNDVGVYSITFDVGLANHPGVVALTKNFTVTITCEVFTLAFT
jgi:hypothetical protein